MGISDSNGDYKDRDLELGETQKSSQVALLIARGGGGGDKEELGIAAAAASSSKRKRLVSLDVFRGLTVALMILVDDAGGLIPAINHSPWNGITLADYVMPFFLFMVGMSLGLVTHKKGKISSFKDRVVATRKAVLRALKLFLTGLVVQGGYLHGINDLTYGVDINRIRWMGTLQRIAIAYLVTALCEIWLKAGDDEDDDVSSNLSLLKKYKLQWVMVLVVIVVYSGLLYGLYVPDWEYQTSSGSTFLVKCGVRGDTGPACNAVGMLDRILLGGTQHLYKRPIYSRTKQCSMKSPDYGLLPSDAPSWCQAPFEPEGLLSSMMAIVTSLIGMHFGHIIVHFKEHKERIMSWMIPSFGLVVVGFILDLLGIHANKALYSISYTCVTAGAAGALFAGIYVMVDVFGFRKPTIVLEWMGKHALMIYILVACNVLPFLLQGFYWKRPENNILSLIGIGTRR